MKKIFALTFILICTIGCLVSCTEANNVNFNLSQAADNFEVVRKITVFNARTDTIVMEMEGLMSLSNDSISELVITCKVGEDKYKKNYVYLNEYVIYVVEDISGTTTDPYHYKVHFYTAIPDLDWNE